MTRELARLVTESSDEHGMARFTLTVLALHADDDGEIAISSRDLAELIGAATYTARRYTRELLRSNAITLLARGRGNRPSRYHVNAPTGTA